MVSLDKVRHFNPLISELSTVGYWSVVAWNVFPLSGKQEPAHAAGVPETSPVMPSHANALSLPQKPLKGIALNI